LDNPVLEDWAKRYLAQFPESLLDFFEGYLEAARTEDEDLLDANYHLMGLELRAWRQKLDEHDEWAEQVRDDFERNFIEAIRHGDLSRVPIVAMGKAMIDEGLEFGDELRARCNEALDRGETQRRLGRAFHPDGAWMKQAPAGDKLLWESFAIVSQKIREKFRCAICP
jgi:hypothetical protein